MQITDRARRIRLQHRIQLAAFFGLLLTIGLILFAVQGLLLSFVIAVVLSYILSPFVSYFEGNGFSRTASTLIVFAFFFGLLILGVAALSPFVVTQFQALKLEGPKYIDGTVQLFERLRNQLFQIGGGSLAFDPAESIRIWLTAQSSNLVEKLPGFLSQSASVLLLSPFIGFFMILDGQRVVRNLFEIVPNNIFEITLHLRHQINDQIGNYIRARILESGIVSIVIMVGLLSIDFPYAVLLAVFNGFTNFIPYIGPVIGALPAVVIALINGASPAEVALVLAVFIVAQIIDIFLVIPLMVAKVVDLHPVTVVLAVIVGGELLGVLGMLISIPVASALKVISSTIYKHLTDFTGAT
jgi:putative permease